MGIMFKKGGMLTTVQDEGRFGFQQYGVSPAGPMDTRAFHIANLLAGNQLSESALEITAMGPEIYFEAANVIAITGADLIPCINGEEVANYQALSVKEGDVLAFRGMRSGVRAYIAFAGGLDVPVVMGSKSTLIRNCLGGVKGRAVKAEDRIGFSAPQTSLPRMEQRKMIPAPTQTAGREILLRVIPGPQEDHFTTAGYRQFFWHGAVISQEFDRMGCRLICDPIEHQGDGNIITDGIAFGAIQVPPNGQPIIMLADRQSTGGYPKIGTVASVDLPLLAQALPGYKIRFIEIRVDTAQLLYVKELNQMQQLWDKLNI